MLAERDQSNGIWESSSLTRYMVDKDFGTPRFEGFSAPHYNEKINRSVESSNKPEIYDPRLSIDWKLRLTMGFGASRLYVSQQQLIIPKYMKQRSLKDSGLNDHAHSIWSNGCGGIWLLTRRYHPLILKQRDFFTAGVPSRNLALTIYSGLHSLWWSEPWRTLVCLSWSLTLRYLWACALLALTLLSLGLLKFTCTLLALTLSRLTLSLLSFWTCWRFILCITCVGTMHTLHAELQEEK